MKAKQWSDKISGIVKEILVDHPDFNRAPLDAIEKHRVVVADLVHELDADMIRLKADRHVSTLPGMRGIILELNSKWNAVAKNASTLLTRDGYLNLLKKRMPVETAQILKEGN